MGLDDKEVYSIIIHARTDNHPSEEEFSAVLIYLRQEHAGHFDITGKCMTGILHKLLYPAERRAMSFTPSPYSLSMTALSTECHADFHNARTMACRRPLRHKMPR